MKRSQAARPKKYVGEFYEAPLDLENPKRNAILLAAGKLFIEQGYEPVSMDAIAAEADVSKRTVYSYFESKSALFSSVLLAHCNRMGGVALPDDFAGCDPRKVLTEFGRVFLTTITSQRAVAMQRVIFREVERLPELGKIFFEIGPGRQTGRLIEYLKHAESEGRLKVGDPVKAAAHFMAIAKAPFHLPQLCGLIDEVSPGEIDRSVKETVSFFLSVYGPGRG
jgi:TetR/AcrR family transcriptional regulator, mexJK operon transcriptional repressor